MSVTPYRLDPRTRDEIRRELRAAAARTKVPGVDDTWDELLFDDAKPLGEPSRALLEAVVELHAGLAEHVSLVPRRLLGEWLSTRLGIAGLPAVPDRVVVDAIADPARTPAVVPAGAAVRAKDSGGRDRRYATTETLTVHGVQVLDVRSYYADADGDGASRWEDRSVPFAPFATEAATHAFYVFSDVLAFSGGEMEVQLTFQGGNDARKLDSVLWEYSTEDGLGRATRVSSAAGNVRLHLTGSCVAGSAHGYDLPYLCASLPDAEPGAPPLTFAFTAVKVEVTSRTVAPDGAKYNDGNLDVTKEFQPFGPAARRGDAFYVSSEEAFSKPVDELTIALQLLDPDGGLLSPVAWGPVDVYKIKSAQESAATYYKDDESGRKFFDKILGYLGESGVARVDWQRYDGSGWHTLEYTTGELASMTWTGSPGPHEELSRPLSPEEPERYVRAFLARGDFGWQDYLQRVARFAAEAAGTPATPSASDLIPPDPPVVSAISIAYKTAAAPADGLGSDDGWARRKPSSSGAYFPFAIPVDLTSGSGGMVAIGLALGAAALGTALSLYIDVESAAACDADDDAEVRWQYWSGGEWSDIDVADGTLGLRQAGLLRLVAPLNWAEGSSELSATEGRWLRAVTASPDAIGTIRAILPDAVEAVRSDLAAAAGTLAEPIGAGEVKGLLVPVPGIKKVTNTLPGAAGGEAEKPVGASYQRRAAGTVRHRGRAVQPWDYEELVSVGFPEVAAVRCLPHTCSFSGSSPGRVGLVVVPRSLEPMPLPSISLAERIRSYVEPSMPMHARLAILCPLYVPVTVRARLALVRGASAVEARVSVTDELERFLHPTTQGSPRFGRELFASSVAARLEKHPLVDHVVDFELEAGGAPVERVPVDPCRGLTASSGSHDLALVEQL
jgi:Baseplate J-like protein